MPIDMKTHYIIQEGFTLDYLIHSIVLFVVSATLMVFFWPAGVILLAVSIVLIGLQAGIEVDLANKQIRTYHAFATIRKGDWFSLQDFDAAILKLERENTTTNILPMATGGAMAFGGARTQAKSYELVFVRKDDHQVSFHEFIDYPLARKVCKILEKGLVMEVTDEFGEIHKKSLAKRKKRGSLRK